MYQVPLSELTAITADTNIPTTADVRQFLGDARYAPLTPRQVNLLISAIHSPEFPAIRSAVIAASADVRRSKYGNSVVTMAPIEVTNRCASDCNFCGWRANNKQMKRLSIDDELVGIQVRYLLNKGIRHIELVGGDDVKFVRDTLPALVPALRGQIDKVEGGQLLFCTMALTEAQYNNLAACGADGMIMWQETYDEELYNRHITSGPKAHGVDDKFKVVKSGDGFLFRLQSQDRAAKAGLGLSVGAMLGLNKNIAFEVLATIHHARYLCTTYNPKLPVIVGMPTWNNITTAETDTRPEQTLDMEDYFSYFASIYLLGLSDKNIWVFPNCRVSLASQVEAVRAAGAYTSTEVKVGPGGYLAEAIRDLDSETRDSVIRKLRGGLKAEGDFSALIDRLDELEQFQHHFHLHEDYVAALVSAGIDIADGRAAGSSQRTLAIGSGN
jgi:2-iminoacetate synthase ThiH